MSTPMSIGSNPYILSSMSDAGMGAFIRAKRQALGLSQAALAGRAGLSRAYLSQIEGGKVGVTSADVRRRLARALGVRHIDLLVAAGELLPDEVAPVAARWPPGEPERIILHELVEQLPGEDLAHVQQALRAVLALADREGRRRARGEPNAAHP